MSQQFVDMDLPLFCMEKKLCSYEILIKWRCNFMFLREAHANKKSESTGTKSSKLKGNVPLSKPATSRLKGNVPLSKTISSKLKENV